MKEKKQCGTCSLCTEFEYKFVENTNYTPYQMVHPLNSQETDDLYKDEIWCEYHQQPKFKDDTCDTYIKKSLTGNDLKIEV